MPQRFLPCCLLLAAFSLRLGAASAPADQAAPNAPARAGYSTPPFQGTTPSCPEATHGEIHHGLTYGGPMTRKAELLGLSRSNGGQRAWHTIWDNALYDPHPSVAAYALSFFQARPIPRPLSPEEKGWILQRIQSGNSLQAQDWAQALWQSGLATNAQTLGVIVDRFLKDVRFLPPPHSEYRLYGRWLNIIGSTDPDLTLSILRSREHAEANARTRAWLAIARGMLGDTSAEKRLSNLVERQGLPESIRALALCAYARSMQEKAVPLLRKYQQGLTDNTNAPSSIRMPPFPPMRRTAISELHRLGEPLTTR